MVNFSLKTYNQLNNINNEGTGLISNSSAHFQDYSIDKTLAKQEYTYNANGAMASDLNKGISSITYNSLNLPTKLTIDNISKGGKAKGTIEYMYSAAGVKLRTVHTDNAAIAKNAPILTAGVFATTTDVKTTDYVGNKIYENGKLKQTLIDGGYIKDGKYYYYLTDHLGNNRAVAEATTGTLLQKTHYYPFGMAFAETTGEQEQPFKYNGKELDREMQLNTYDYAARYMDPAIGRFTSIDPHAENYYSTSPYAYVMNNPLKYIDPDGRKVVMTVALKGGKTVSLTLTQQGFANSAGNVVALGNGRAGQVADGYMKMLNSGDNNYIHQVTTLINSEHTHEINLTTKSNSGVTPGIRGESTKEAKSKVMKGEGISTTTNFDFSGDSYADGTEKSNYTTTAHEVQHQYDFDQGKMADAYDKNGQVKGDAKSPAEKRAVYNEDKAREQEGFNKRRTYGGQSVD